MAYRNLWSDTIPTNASAANIIGDLIRAVREDMHDRLLDKFFANMTADPIQFSMAFLNKVGYGQETFIVPGSALQVPSNGNLALNVTMTGVSTIIHEVAGIIVAHVPFIGFPVGRKITRVRALIQHGDFDVITDCILQQSTLNFATSTITTTTAHTFTQQITNGVKSMDSGALSLNIPDTSPYYSFGLRFTIQNPTAGPWTFYGAMIEHEANSF